MLLSLLCAQMLSSSSRGSSNTLASLNTMCLASRLAGILNNSGGLPACPHSRIPETPTPSTCVPLPHSCAATPTCRCPRLSHRLALVSLANSQPPQSWPGLSRLVFPCRAAPHLSRNLSSVLLTQAVPPSYRPVAPGHRPQACPAIPLPHASPATPYPAQRLPLCGMYVRKCTHTHIYIYIHILKKYI